MFCDAHERARFLIDESRIGGISREDARWLEEHIAECPECARFEETTAKVVEGLEGLAFDFGAVEVRVRPRRRAMGAWRWAMAAAAVLLLAAAPVYRKMRAERLEREDAQLLMEVENHVSRTVPRAMEPLVQPRIGEPQ